LEQPIEYGKNILRFFYLKKRDMKKSAQFILLKIAMPLFGAALLICSCQKDDSTLPKPDSNQVWIQHNSYYPSSLTVSPGSIITWTNKDNYSHTVTSNINGLFDSDQIQKGRSFSYKFNKEGTFTYYCKNHLGEGIGMIGVIEVK